MFVVVSGVTLAATRPLVKRITGKKKQALNADRIIGSTAVVSETVDNLKGTGCVKVSGVPWTARSADDSVIETGKSVSVEKIEGVKVIVKEI
ncbi:MAG: NfeD family protein [Clostridia bacterium]|nr:NfeD family protein [Clostridia bacterium]